MLAVEETVTPVERKRLFDCQYFSLWTLRGREEFTVGAEEMPRVLVCTAGAGQIEHGDITYSVGKGEVWLLPAVVEKAFFAPVAWLSCWKLLYPPSPSRKH